MGIGTIQQARFSILGACYLAPGWFVHLTPSRYAVVLACGVAWMGAAAWLGWRVRRRTGTGDRGFYLGALTLFLLAGAFVTLVYPPTTDEPHYLMLTESLLSDGDIDLANNYMHQDHLKFYPGATLDPHVVICPDGRWFAQHTIGLSLLVLPGYALAGRWGSLLILALVAACLPVLLRRISVASGAGARESTALAVLVTATGPLAFGSTLMFPEVPAAVLAAAGLTTTASWWLPAACAAALPWLHPRFAVLSFGLLAVHVLENRRRGAIIAAWSGAAIVSGGFFLFVYHGEALVAALNVLTEHYPARLEDIGGATVTGNMGLRYLLPGIGAKLFDREFGVIPFAPWLLAGIPGVWVATRRRGFPHARLLVAGGAYALITCLYRNWAGSAYPGRTLIALLPFTAPYLATGIRWAGKTPGRRGVFGALALVSILTAWLLTACPVLRYTSGRDWMAARGGVAWRILPFNWFPRFTLLTAPK